MIREAHDGCLFRPPPGIREDPLNRIPWTDTYEGLLGRIEGFLD
jgi:hypothetical protein